MSISKKNKSWFKVIIIVGTVGIIFLALKVYVAITPSTENLTDWQRYNDSLNLANKAFAEKNPHQFTDIPRNFEKDSDVYRIAVLGDSFVWGDGLPYDSAWSHKLEQKMLAKYDNVEVMHWGINGWQTKEELAFYSTDGSKYKPDLLIIGYVDNDPDMGRFKHMDPHFRENYSFFYKLWPGLAEKIISKAYAKSYGEWLTRLYGEENLTLYKKLWTEFMDTLAYDQQDYFVVLTPACISYSCDDYYNIIDPVFDSMKLEYINLIPACKERLSEYTYEELLANPANYHPGTKMTNVFADEVLLYIEGSGRLPELVKDSADISPQ
jgi:hypothetical protein